jgi:hypothetical protein
MSKLPHAVVPKVIHGPVMCQEVCYLCYLCVLSVVVVGKFRDLHQPGLTLCAPESSQYGTVPLLHSCASVPHCASWFVLVIVLVITIQDLQ